MTRRGQTGCKRDHSAARRGRSGRSAACPTCRTLRLRLSAAGDGGAPAVPGDPLAVPADLAGAPASAAAAGRVDVHQRAVVPRALPQRGPRDRVGEQLDRVPRDHGEQGGALRRRVQPPYEGAVFTAYGTGAGVAARARSLRRARAGDRAGAAGAPWSGARQAWTNCRTHPRSSRNAVTHDRSAEGRRVPCGTSPEAVIQAHNGGRECSRSTGCAVASRSRQGRPASNRCSCGAVAVPGAMCLSPPR